MSGIEERPQVSRSIFHPHVRDRVGEMGSGPRTFPPTEKPDVPSGTPRKDKKKWTRRQKVTAALSIPLAGIASVVGLSRLINNPTPERNGETAVTSVVPMPETSIPTQITKNTAPPTTEAPVLTEQQIVDNLLSKAGYLEMKGREVVFRDVIQTADSVTHVLSFLPESILPKESYNHEAAQAIIEFNEAIAKEGIVLTWSPLKTGENKATRRVVPSIMKKEKFVIFFSGEDPVPADLKSRALQSTVVDNALKNNTTVASTINGTSYLRIAEFETYRYSLPKPKNGISTPLEQLNALFTAESVAAATWLDQYDADAFESFKNTLYPTEISAQEGAPFSLMEDRLGMPISQASRRVYYPGDDGVMAGIYDRAPKTPAISASRI